MQSTVDASSSGAAEAGEMLVPDLDLLTWSDLDFDYQGLPGDALADAAVSHFNLKNLRVQRWQESGGAGSLSLAWLHEECVVVCTRFVVFGLCSSKTLVR
jgi:hypothetical protein